MDYFFRRWRDFPSGAEDPSDKSPGYFLSPLRAGGLQIV
jgi:hypothetical protein